MAYILYLSDSHSYSFSITQREISSVKLVITSERNLIEAVKVAFSLLLIDHPRFLEEVIGHVAADGVSLEIKIDVHVLSETRRIVVSICLGIAERLQYRVRLDENIFHPEKIIFIAYN